MTAHAQQHCLHYCQFMDGWILLTGIKRQLHTGVVGLLNAVAMQKALNQSFKWRAVKGFDSLRSRLENSAAHRLGIAQQPWINHCYKLLRLFQAPLEEVIEWYGMRWAAKSFTQSAIVTACDDALAGWRR